MRKSSSTPMLLAVAGIAIGAMVVLNIIQYENRPKTSQEILAEEQEKGATPPPNGRPTPPPAKDDAGVKLVALGPDARIGPADARKILTLGYYWTPEVQAEPMRVYGPIEMIEKMGASQGIAIRVVALDLPNAPKVPPGISENGKVIAQLRPEGGFEPQAIQEVLPRLMQSP